MAQNIKTIQGVALASVKTIQGIAIASIKTIQGIDNTAGGGPNAFSDDFAGTGALGANWTVSAGAADRSSDKFRIQTGSFANVIAVYNTSAGSLTQYQRFTLSANNQYPWMIFRYTDASSPFYALLYDGVSGEVYWYHHANAASSGTQIGTAQDTGGDMTGVVTGITLTGTGANTDIRIWRGITGLPSSVTDWNGDTTPDATYLTTDPGAFAVDTGQIVGIGGQQSVANNVTLDDWAAGGL